MRIIVVMVTPSHLHLHTSLCVHLFIKLSNIILFSINVKSMIYTYCILEWIRSLKRLYLKINKNQIYTTFFK